MNEAKVVLCDNYCKAVCMHCVYMYKHHNEEWNQEGSGLCTITHEKTSYKGKCENFFCKRAIKNPKSPEDIRNPRFKEMEE